MIRPYTPLVRALLAIVLAVLVTSALALACKKPADERTPPPPEPARASVDCAKNPGAVSDPVTQPLLPAVVGGVCLDPSAESRAYGKDAKRGLDEVCTELFDGECESYKALGLERVVTLRYVDPAVKGAAINVHVSRFPGAEAAFAFYTRRVVGDVDPATLKLEPFAAGAAASRGTGVAYAVRDRHVVELTYLDDAATTASLADAAKRHLEPLATAIASKLPGAATMPAAAALLPDDRRVPLGVVFTTTDLSGVKGLGAGAAGFYRDGARRWRVGVAVLDTEDAARRALEAARAWASSTEPPRALPVKGWDAFAASRREDAASPTLAWVFGRAGTKVAFVADEEHVRRAKQTADEARAVTIDEAQKLDELARALGRGGKKP